MNCRLRLAALLLLAAPLPARADALQDAVTTVLASAGPGTRWGMVVADDAGREILAIDPEGRYIPASNTKVFTTAAAYFATQGTLALPEAGTTARLRANASGPPDVILTGHGDPRLSTAPDCQADCLSALADKIAAATRKVGVVIGDDAAFPDQRWSPGMSWNNIPTPSGTGISALTIDDNEITATVTPGAAAGTPPIITVDGLRPRNLATTSPGAEQAIGFDRMPDTDELVVTGTIGLTAKPQTLHLGVDDPAQLAATRLTAMLRTRGVKVLGEPQSLHRPLLPTDDPAQRGTAPLPAPDTPEAPLAALTALPLAEDITVINKQSQNLHAELLLRRLGRLRGSGSIADGLVIVRQMLDAAGVTPAEASFADGSGMSSYNRVAPRGMVRLLAWIARQPWGAQWRATLPIAGTDGTLKRRFTGTPLAGKLMAKTGTLNASNALSGYLIAKSGRVLTFAIYANDQPDGVSAGAIMDRALGVVADRN